MMTAAPPMRQMTPMISESRTPNDPSFERVAKMTTIMTARNEAAVAKYQVT